MRFEWEALACWGVKDDVGIDWKERHFCAAIDGSLDGASSKTNSDESEKKNIGNFFLFFNLCFQDNLLSLFIRLIKRSRNLSTVKGRKKKT